MIKGMIKPALVLTVICIVVAGLVSGAALLTRGTIETKEQNTVNEAKREVLSAAATFEKTGAEEYEAYAGLDSDGKIVGYVVMTKGKGYGGVVAVMTGFDTEGKVTGVVLTSESETQGLGKKANEESFRQQYVGTTDELTVVKGKEAGENEIAAITGATVTSKAVTGAVNEAKKIVGSILNGGDISE